MALEVANISQTVHNRPLTLWALGDPPGLILFFSQFDQQSSHILSLPQLYTRHLPSNLYNDPSLPPLPPSCLPRPPAHCVNLLTIIRKLEQSK